MLSYAFWRRFAEIPEVVAIKIAPFNRYQTLDVVRAVVDAGRDDIALYTGNDDTIVSDLVTPFRFARDGAPVERRIVGGLLGHWAVWTRGAVALLDECHAAARRAAGARGAARSAASRSPTPTRRSSTPLTASPAASPGSRKSCGARACWRAPGVSIRTRRSAPARPPRSIASAMPTRTSQTMTSSRRTSRSGCRC